MDFLETISVDTSLEDELDFLRFALSDRNVHMIAPYKVTLDGPIGFSLRDLSSVRDLSPKGIQDFLLWNTECSNPLCWSLYYSRYDLDWAPVDPRYATTWKPARTKKDFVAMHRSFRQHPIAEATFTHGLIARDHSPVIEISIPSAKDREKTYTVIIAEFRAGAEGVWVVWNDLESAWMHETRDLDELYEHGFEQSPEFVWWQEHLFGWIRRNWADKILPFESYRYGPDSP